MTSEQAIELIGAADYSRQRSKLLNSINGHQRLRRSDVSSKNG